MGFAIKVNDGGAEDTEAWTADYNADEVVAISVQSAGGEVARLQIPNASEGIRLELERRSQVDSTYLDMTELAEIRERADKREAAAKAAVEKAHKEAAKAEAAATEEAAKAEGATKKAT